VEKEFADSKKEVDAENGWNRAEKMMRIPAANPLIWMSYSFDAEFCLSTRRRLTRVVEEKYTTKNQAISG
jgi:hypothetical protein